MSGLDERDLVQAFEELSAPPSTAAYATRTPSLEIGVSRSRWPQTLAGGLVVLVAVGGAGTFLALRSARQAPSSAAGSGAPPARLGAAMAFDSTSGTTVMFGGAGARGTQLADTWTWDGRQWSRVADGPASLQPVQMVDDPADAGVLLLGVPVRDGVAGGGSRCYVVPGGGSSGSVGATADPVTAGAAPSPTGGDYGVDPVRPTGPPLADPVPTAAAAPSASAVAVSPVATCAPVSADGPTAVQTWLFRAGSWSHVAAGTGATAPPLGAELTFDPSTRQVVAVFSAGCSFSILPCPALGAVGSVSSWTWSRGSWHRAADTTLPSAATTLVFTDPATGHATLRTEAGANGYANGVPCSTGIGTVKQPDCIREVPFSTTWSWTGSTWHELSQQPAVELTPDFAGAAVATVGSHIVVLTPSGQTWMYAAGQWTQEDLAGHPSARAGSAFAQGPGGTAVLFGGSAGLGLVVLPGAIGSDTWVWDGTSWRQVGGTQPAPMPAPSVCSASTASPIGCIQPQPAQVSPPVAPTPSP